MAKPRFNWFPTSRSLASDLGKSNRDTVKNRELWTRVLNQFGAAILQGILATGIHPTDAQDVFDSVLDKLEKYLPRFHRDKAKGGVRAYLYRVIWSQLQQHYRDRRRLPVQLNLNNVQLPTSSPSAEDIAEQQRLLEEWQAKCQMVRLAAYRVAVRLRHDGDARDWILYKRRVQKDEKPRHLAEEFGLKPNEVYEVLRRVKNLVKAEYKAIAGR